MEQHDPSGDPGADPVLSRAEAIYRDHELAALADRRRAGTRIVGCAPAYVPTELVDAAGALPAWILGAGPALEVVQGDAYFQSAICHLPRSLMELGLRGCLDPLDLLVVPSTCDVMRNLTGMWQVVWPRRRVRFLELPHRYDAAGHDFYRHELEGLAREIAEAVGVPVTDDGLRRAIHTGNRRRAVLRRLEAMRVAEPWRLPGSELWLAVRAGAVMTPAEHVAFLESFEEERRRLPRHPLDVARVLVTGAFCEQPPLGFLRMLERAGCAIVGDDLLLGMRWLREDVREDGDPWDALVAAYLSGSPLAPCRFEGDERRPEAVVKAVRAHRAAGVVYATPSFCDPALLDRPGILEALDRAGIPCVQLQYAENSVDFGSVREQAGTFADALRLWEATA